MTLLPLLCLLALLLPGLAAAEPATACETISGLQVPREDESAFGARLQHTMRLLAASTASAPATVRVLCYGQSIMGGGHVPTMLTTELRTRYPSAHLVIENRAIGGYSSPKLVRTAEADIVPFRPDLVVLHVYEGEKDGTFEGILRIIRTQTNADLLTWTHHVDALKVDALRDSGSDLQRELVQRYGGEVVEVRALWKRVLELNQLEPKALLQDGIHLNPRGGALLSALVRRHLREYAGPLPAGERGVTRIDLATALGGRATSAGGTAVRDGTVVLAKAGDRLRLPFTGNRLDLLATRQPGTGGSLRILVDGLEPGKTATCMAATRVSTCTGAWFPTIDHITLGPDARPESWTLAIAGASKLDSFTFTLTGSLTGPDGTGAAGRPFVSQSGRIAIDPKDFALKLTRQVAGKDLPDALTATWKVVSMGADAVTAAALAPYRPFTAWQGWTGGAHVLELEAVGDGPVVISAAVVYDPAARK